MSTTATSTSTLTANLKANIGVYTDPEHKLWIDAAEPSVEDIARGDKLEPGEVVVEVKSTGICGCVVLALSLRCEARFVDLLDAGYAAIVPMCTFGMLAASDL